MSSRRHVPPPREATPARGRHRAGPDQAVHDQVLAELVEVLLPSAPELEVLTGREVHGLGAGGDQRVVDRIARIASAALGRVVAVAEDADARRAADLLSLALGDELHPGERIAVVGRRADLEGDRERVADRLDEPDRRVDRGLIYAAAGDLIHLDPDAPIARSEERRVGQESRP